VYNPLLIVCFLWITWGFMLFAVTVWSGKQGTDWFATRGMKKGASPSFKC